MSVAPVARPGVRNRMALVVSTLSGTPAPTGGQALRRAFEELLAPAAADSVWLALAVLRATLPLDSEVVATRRRIALGGPRAAFASLLRPTIDPFELRARRYEVEVATDEVLVDLHHTSHTGLATGIQRVARQTSRRWAAEHVIGLIGWTGDHRALRRLTDSERHVALHGAEQVPPAGPVVRRVVVPWRCTYVLPELATEEARTSRILALARHGGSRTGVIGFDCVPISSGETTGPGMGAAFSLNLTAVRHMDQVATISRAAAREYTGWRRMLAGTGLPGPAITPVLLPAEAQEPTAAALTRVRERFGTEATPLVLCVGSHEPRKNHLAVLHAAELAWQDGHRFSLAFVGGNSWAAEPFTRRMAELVRRGRPVVSVQGMSDDDLWAAYRLARLVLFPSLNEGFGLPVAEALASGTPVITSDFGSMREIAEGGGALLVDPRDDHALTGALVTLLADDDLHARLAAQARGRTGQRTWDRYADDVWDVLVGR
ncbi:MAG: glycosyltransferase family 4 protein [Actinobacteria bacterium]|nr:glycosyltransferase family 4 protein [Actinomycetota bacterium]MCG2799450.1 glycosyltransferase family 4 protein [Cellulomonas sp.]